MEYEKLRDYQSGFIRRNKINHFKTRIKFFFLLFIVVLFIIFSLGREKSPITTFPLKSSDNSPYFNGNIKKSLYQRGYPKLTKIENKNYIEYLSDHKVIYTVIPKLQNKIYSIFKKYKVPYGSFVAMEPDTGKILAYVTYSSQSRDLKRFNLNADYPMASLFKIVTAAAVIEEGLLSRSSVIGYRGNPYRLNKRKIKNNPRYDKNLSSLENAFGKSNNVIFGKVGANILGNERLLEYAEKFAFNSTIEFDFPLDQSYAEIPDNKYRLARVSAGFSGVKTSPLHASLIASTIANSGNMPRPILVDRILTRDGETIYQSHPITIKKSISNRTSTEIKKMMLKTVKNGTSSKIFKKYAKKMVKKINIGGKTGSLYGNNPPGHYDWFIGFAPEKNPKIALAVLVINNNKWKIKGSYVAQAAFKNYLEY